MQNATLWRSLLDLDRAVVEKVELEEESARLIAHVRPTKGATRRCGRCLKRCGWYDHGEGRRRWRALDLGTVQVWLEAAAPRVQCRVHGVVVAHVPWARHGAGHTRAFDQQVAWLATHCSKSAITQLMRIAWRTVGAIIARVWDDTGAKADRFAGLRRIGIDEISYKRHHKYLTVVVDHDTGRLVWASPGPKGGATHAFFIALETSGVGRCAQITHVSADSASWITAAVEKYCPTAVRCADHFHVVSWATEALDAVRRDAWNQARRAGRTRPHRRDDRRPGAPAPGHAQALKSARYALWKNPENLTGHQRAKLEWIAKVDPRLYRAYLLKEALRTVFKLPFEQAAYALERWIGWARRSRLPSFVKLQQRISRHRAEILAAIEHRMSNALVESANTKARLITRIGFGFHDPHALIALMMLTLGGHRPALPGR